MDRCIGSAFVLWMVVVTGCAGGAASKPAMEFPSQAQLGEVRTRPVPSDVPMESTDLGLGFETSEAVAGLVQERPVEPSGVWEKMLAGALAGAREVQLTEQARCAAAQLGAFYLKRGAYPSGSLRRFMLGRCGSSASDMQPMVATTEVPEDMPEASVFKAWRGALEGSIGKQIGNAPGAAGVWFGRQAGKAVVAIARTRRFATLEPFNPHPDDKGWVEIEGTLTGSAEVIVAHINHGEYGVSECDVRR